MISEYNLSWWSQSAEFISVKLLTVMFSSSLLQATLATTSITQPNLTPDCQRERCIVGNVGVRFWWGRIMCGLKRSVMMTVEETFTVSSQFHPGIPGGRTWMSLVNVLIQASTVFLMRTSWVQSLQRTEDTDWQSPFRHQSSRRSHFFCGV